MNFISIARRSSLVGLSLVLPLSSMTVVAATDRFDDVREYIRAELLEQSVPSIAVAVAQNGRIIWEEGFGWADREKCIRATEHTVYSVASVSKPITATGLMTLVQAGKVDLDKPANDYLGNAKLRARVGDASAATVRRVADHSSGLPLHWQFFYADEPDTPPSLDETILRYGNLVTLPGERFTYSNLGYGVLDSIIERVSGRSYAQFMRQEVFLPLGMRHTSIYIAPGLQADTATGYGSNGLPLALSDSNHPGAAAVYSSAHDLARFGMFHLKAHLRDQKAILSDASIDEMHRSTVDRGRGFGYGIGFEVSVVDGYRMVHHSGGMDGASTQMLLFPDHQLVVVTLSNARAALQYSVADRIVTKLLPKWRPDAREKWPAPPAFVMPDSLLGTWKGMLATCVKDVPVVLRFLPTGEAHAKFGDQLTTLVSDPGFVNGVFTGDLSARVGTPDTERHERRMSLSLKLRGDALNGAASVIEVDGPRQRSALTHWLEVRKE